MEYDLTPIKQEVEDFLNRPNNQNIEINTHEDYTKAGDFYKAFKSKAKELNEKRLSYTRPLDKTKKMIKADFDRIIKPMEDFADDLKLKMVLWAKEEQKKIDEEQARLDAQAAAYAEKRGLDPNTIVPVSAGDIQKTKGSHSTSSITKKWTYAISDSTKVPREFLTVDDQKIKQAIKQGKRNIDGLNIYQEESITIR